MEDDDVCTGDEACTCSYCTDMRSSEVWANDVGIHDPQH